MDARLSRRIVLRMSAIAFAVAWTLCPMLTADDAVPAEAPLRWWKGNIHTHTFWSDGNDFPEMVAEWYRTHDYNFLALSDHNILSEGQRWMDFREVVDRGGDTVLPKYLGRFGDHWVETRGTPGQEAYAIRLKPLNEFRALVEERGKFIMIAGEEISDSVKGKPVHMNATNLRELLQPLGGDTVAAAIRANLRAAEDQAEREGREILVHLNHPNFYYAVTAKDLSEVLEERFYEVYNGHPGVNHLGDDTHPGVERIWDLANTLRLYQWHAAPLMGVATDDSHAYHGSEGSTPGRGWVMVHARHLTPESLIHAMKQSDFYASSGVSLELVRFDANARKFSVHVQTNPETRYVIEFVGTRVRATGADDETPAPVDPQQIGVVFARHEGPQATYSLQGDELYVRRRDSQFSAPQSLLRESASAGLDATGRLGTRCPLKQTVYQARGCANVYLTAGSGCSPLLVDLLPWRILMLSQLSPCIARVVALALLLDLMQPRTPRPCDHQRYH